MHVLKVPHRARCLIGNVRYAVNSPAQTETCQVQVTATSEDSSLFSILRTYFLSLAEYGGGTLAHPITSLRLQQDSPHLHRIITHVYFLKNSLSDTGLKGSRGQRSYIDQHLENHFRICNQLLYCKLSNKYFPGLKHTDYY